MAKTEPDEPTEPGDEELRKKAFEFFDKLGERVQASFPYEISAVHEPMRIGPWRTLAEIGQGGMGSVFLAERADGQFEQKVALKLLRVGMDTPEARRRFVAERQILARLQHPNIARLIDGGVTEEGRPYFVMEHVAGMPIVDYCDRRRLGVEERLQLLRSVAEAVQYAHRNLVVHRDLKPGNIFVGEDATVKLLDFGIAKVLSEEDLETGLTRAGARPMTPVYAAPEQFRSEPITTATDVYALGVVLFELLTGELPYPVRGRSPTEVERTVLETEPEKPSAVAKRAGAEAAAARGTTGSKLARRLLGELDTIVLMALRKEPERRYRSAEQLAEDIRRHLTGRPVTALADSVGYRTAKFVRRNRAGVAATAAIVVLALGFGVAMALQSARIAHERDKAQRVAGLFVDLFKFSDPAEARGGQITAREVLDRGADKIEKGLEGQPEVQAELMGVMGRVYQSLGVYPKAAPLLEKSLALRKQALGPEHREVADSLNALGDLMRQQGDYPKAVALLTEAIALGRRLDGPASPRVAVSLNHLGKTLYGKGDYTGAEKALQEALAINRKALGPRHVEVGETLNNLAAIAYALGDDATAEPLFREALGIRREALGPDHPLVAATLNNLGSLLSRKGDYAAAEQVNREALELYRKLHGQEHPRIATSLNNLGLVFLARNDYAGAEPLFRESLAMRRKLLPPGHPDIAQTGSNLGLLLQKRGQYPEAEALYREALAIRQKALGPAHPLVAGSLNNLGMLLQIRRQFDEAETDYRQGLDMLRKQFGNAHALVAISLTNLGSLARDRGDLAKAEALYRDSLAIRRKVLRPGHPDTAHSLVGLGRVLAARRSYEEAEALLQEGLDLREKALPPGAPETDDARGALVELYTAWGKPDEAERHRSALSGRRS